MVRNFSFIRIIQACQDWTFRIFAVDFKEKTTYDRLQTIRFAHSDYGLLHRRGRLQTSNRREKVGCWRGARCYLPILRWTPLCHSQGQEVSLPYVQEELLLQDRYYLRGQQPLTSKVVRCDVPHILPQEGCIILSVGKGHQGNAEDSLVLCFRRYVCSISRAMRRLSMARSSAMRCISAARRNGSTSLCAHHILKVVQRRQRHQCSV